MLEMTQTVSLTTCDNRFCNSFSSPSKHCWFYDCSPYKLVLGFECPINHTESPPDDNHSKEHKDTNLYVENDPDCFFNHMSRTPQQSELCEHEFSQVMKAVLNTALPTWWCVTRWRMSSVILVLNMKTVDYLAHIFSRWFAEQHIPSFVSVLAAVIRWVLNHPLMLQLGNKDFNLFILSGGTFFFHCLESRCIAVNNGQQPSHS